MLINLVTFAVNLVREIARALRRRRGGAPEARPEAQGHSMPYAHDLLEQSHDSLYKQLEFAELSSTNQSSLDLSELELSSSPIRFDQLRDITQRYQNYTNDPRLSQHQSLREAYYAKEPRSAKKPMRMSLDKENILNVSNITKKIL